MIKTRFGGYDGKGQLLITNETDLDNAKALIEKQECVAENF